MPGDGGTDIGDGQIRDMYQNLSQYLPNFNWVGADPGACTLLEKAIIAAA